MHGGGRGAYPPVGDVVATFDPEVDKASSGAERTATVPWQTVFAEHVNLLTFFLTQTDPASWKAYNPIAS